MATEALGHAGGFADGHRRRSRVAVGAIVQVTWEMFDLVRADIDEGVDHRLVAAFVVGVFVLVVLEDVIVGGWLGL